MLTLNMDKIKRYTDKVQARMDKDYKEISEMTYEEMALINEKEFNEPQEGLYVSESTFKAILKKYNPTLALCLEEKLINQLKVDCQVPSDQYFPNCGYIVDATFQEIYIPSRSFELAKKYFSGKHSIYCLKSQVIVTLKGQAVHIVTSIPRSVHDKKVFDDFNSNVIGQHPNDPSKVIGDKGYRDNNSRILVTPYKGNPTNLNHQQMQFNNRLGKVRIIVENFFGRLKMRYDIMKSRYRGDHVIYECYFKICAALVNFEIVMLGHPLRNDDSDFYPKFMAKKKDELLFYKNERKKASSNQRPNTKWW